MGTRILWFFRDNLFYIIRGDLLTRSPSKVFRMHVVTLLRDRYFFMGRVALTIWSTLRPRIFFFYLGFLSRTFTNHRTAEKGEGISLTPHYHFHPLHGHLDISRVITAKSLPLRIPGTFGFRAQVANH